MPDTQTPEPTPDVTLPGDPTVEEKTDEELKQRNSKFKQQIDLTKLYRRKLVRDWQVNVDYRRGKPFASQADEDRIAVPLDWTLTKQKQAALFSQVPAVRVNHPPQTVSQEVAPWLHNFEQKVNDTTILSGVESVMDECVPDCINAAGIGVAMASREAITENVQVPSIDLSILPPEIQQQIMSTGMLPNGQPIPMETVPREIDSRYYINRISPADFLWPIGFNSSDFNKAPWIGHSGRAPWATALQRFSKTADRPNGITAADKSKVLGDDRSTLDRIDRLRSESERGTAEYDDTVPYDEIFYWEHKYDPECKSFSTIHHLVFVHGKELPVIDEPWKGQQIDKESNQLIGAQKYPIQVLTLSYITDDAIPPSDSAIGRPPVDEINRSRSQMIQQRQHSMPARWVNTDRMDPSVLYTLMRGTWQGMIPIQGVGTNAMGEVPRSSFPVENWAFDKTAKNDVTEAWGAGGSLVANKIETKGESDAIESDLDTRTSRERAKVARFFISLSEILGGLISIFEDPNSFGEGFSPLISRTLAYSILADSTVLLDSNQRLKRLEHFINFTAKSGRAELDSVLKEYATLSGLDPNVVIKKPEPSPPVEPNISLRLTGIEDLMNPLVLAFLMKSGQAPDPKLIEEAKKLIEIGVTPPPQPPPGPVPMGPDGQPLPALQEVMPPPEPPPPAVGEANPQWTSMNKINKRTESLER